VRDRLLQMGFPAERVELHHIGVDLAGASAHRAEARDPQLVMFAGRLVPHKGAGDLVAAMGDRRLSGCRLLVVGDGPSRMALERDAAARGVAAEFTGFLPQAEVWRLIGRASVVVVPSRTADNGWVEAFGLVAAEAQAAGVPVIASTCGGLPEAVAPSCTGLLFPEGDVGALADRLASVVDDPGVARRLGDEARTWTEAHLNLANQNRRLEDIYEEVA
jgi:phosphatidylinositol alpha-1,6-mannosyltransferase